MMALLALAIALALPLLATALARNRAALFISRRIDMTRPLWEESTRDPLAREHTDRLQRYIAALPCDSSRMRLEAYTSFLAGDGFRARGNTCLPPDGKMRQDPVELFLAGMLAFRVGHRAEAMDLWSSADAGPYFVGLGRRQVERGEYHGAVRDLEIATRLLPDRAEAYEWLAQARYRLADYAGATQAAQQALPLGDHTQEAYVVLGDIAIWGQRKAREGADWYLAGLHEFPNNTTLQVRAGQAYLVMGQFEDAGKVAEQVLAGLPNEPAARQLLASALEAGYQPDATPSSP
jgi:tetratricopeptide (TPR) repeat protein